MLNSVAVLSDIHGALPALDAVLAEPAVQAASHLVVTGDIAAGPQPVQVLDRLASLGDKVILVRGNADREMALLASGGTSANDMHSIVPWAAAQLRPDQIELLANLPYPVIAEVAGFGPVLFCHGAPADDDAIVLVDSRPERWTELLAGLPPEVQTVVCGHTHMPFVRLADRRLIVNPGSIGMPYGRAGAHWALLSDGGVLLRRTLFDVEAASESIRQSCSYPEVAEWTDYYLNAEASDFEAISVFGPRDGRHSA